MLIKKNKTANISNYFVKSDNIGKDLAAVAKKVNDGVFGIEMHKSEDVVSRWLITPPSIRIRPGTMDRITIVDDFTFYEGYLSDPFFLPLYGELNGECVADIERIVLESGERICLQWLFRKKTINKIKTMDMYESYLMGNGIPVASPILRSLQESVLGMLNKISDTNTEREYNVAVEDKIASFCLQFQLKVGIRSNRQKELKEEINEILSQYNDCNTLRIGKVKDKYVAQQFQGCSMVKDANNIISVKEFISLLGVNVSSSPVSQPQAEVVQVPKVNVSRDKAVELLPFIPRKEVNVDYELPSKLAGAMKRVGLIPQARLVDESVTSGIRLTIVECRVPKNKTFSQIHKKAMDVKVALGVPSLGIEQGSEPDTIRFSIPNTDPAMVCLRELIESPSFQSFKAKNPLAFIVGLDEVNNPIYLSLAKLVHLLIAGTTGSGKSVFVNSLAITLILTYGPDELRLVMIDPKQVELQHFRGFPHVDNVITDMKLAYETLGKLVVEMEDRYKRFAELGVKNIELYNTKADTKMPYIVCIVDEFADLKDQHKEVEEHMGRLGQMARAAGIHMVVATQRPDVKVISGRIKSVIPGAISFMLQKPSDYRTIFGTGIPISGGLLGRGDGVMSIPGWNKTFQRFQSAIISPDELEEEAIFDKLKEYYGGKEEVETVVAPQIPEDEEEEPEVVPDDTLERLKAIIADTKETRTGPLREALGVKNTTLTELMGKLVEQGWLIKHKEKQKGYELIAPDYLLEEYKS
jgi:S-DNA-T family DNA segregation ATPase FtsK/SpoIIIE